MIKSIRKKKIFLKILILVIPGLFFTINVQSQIGTSVSFSTDKALGINVFYSENANSFYFGFSQQFNGQKNTVVRERKNTYGTTPMGDGNYYWLLDFGYSRTFIEKLIIQPEISVGGKNFFTNYSDKRFKDNGYSLIGNSKVIAGIGLNLGYKINDFIEPYCGYHTTKKITFGIRIHFKSLY